MSLPAPGEPRQGGAPLIYDGDDVVVRRDEGASDWTLVTFNEVSMVAAGGRYWGQSFARKAGLTAIGFVTKSLNWFPTPATMQAIEAIAPHLRPDRPRVLYGHSMGAYAAIKFSRALRAETVVASCPQSTIDPTETGTLTAYARYFSEKNRGMRIEAGDVGGRIILLYDPCDANDAFHAGRIAGFAGVRLIPMRHTAHEAIRCFASSAEALRLIDLCRREAGPELLRFVAGRRRLYGARARNVALALAKRRPHWALRILVANSGRWQVKDIAQVYAAAGEGFFKARHQAQAEHCIMAATELNPAQANHALLRSVLLFYTDRHREALDWAERTLALEPDHAFARRHRDEVANRIAQAG